ncbi:MAG: hypothetical protein LIO79_00160 [Rikenellaceae bacterium]|nr:hypothetical protein [Rikenellaceae bacterium]
MNEDLSRQIAARCGERRPRVAIQGFEGCFHQIAAQQALGREMEIVPCATFRKVAQSIEDGTADFGVMAIENSIAGSILQNYSILQNSSLKIIGETYLLIQQHLMANKGVKPEDIEEVQSHPIALLQCVDYLDRYHWKLIETEDTALSAKNVADSGSKNTAAVAGELVAELFFIDIV